MGKRFLYRTFLLVGCVWCAMCFGVCASSNTNSDNNSGDSFEQGIVENGDAEPSDTGTEVDTSIDGEGISDEVGEEPTRNIKKIIEPLETIESGEATQTDIYNALVSIHNLLFISFLVVLMAWTYKMITSSFRRFIG